MGSESAFDISSGDDDSPAAGEVNISVRMDMGVGSGTVQLSKQHGRESNRRSGPSAQEAGGGRAVGMGPQAGWAVAASPKNSHSQHDISHRAVPPPSYTEPAAVELQSQPRAAVSPLSISRAAHTAQGAVAPARLWKSPWVVAACLCCSLCLGLVLGPWASQGASPLSHAWRVLTVVTQTESGSNWRAGKPEDGGRWPLVGEAEGAAGFKFPINRAFTHGLGPSYWPDNPNGIRPEAQAHVRAGVLLLHVFWYDQAYLEFHHASLVDPRYGMAYWGMALSHKQMLWQTEDVDAATAALAKMDKKADLSLSTPRELRLLGAVRALYPLPGEGEGGREEPTLEIRERAFAAAMEAVHREFPEDGDACAFFAQSLIAMVASKAAYLHPQTEMQEVLGRARHVLGLCAAKWPRHAGLLHYTTHAYDFPDPGVASRGLWAGLRLSEIATSACHALHMKSHLFLQLGNWSQVIDSNQHSVLASDDFCNRVHGVEPSPSQNSCDADDRYHALEWWAYGLTQRGAFADANALLGRMLAASASLSHTAPFRQWALRMWSHVVVQSHAWPHLPPLGKRAHQDPQHSFSNQVTLHTLMNLCDPEVSSLDGVGEGLFWELHARAQAVVAGAWAATVHAGKSTGVADITPFFERAAFVAAGLLQKVPENMPYIRARLTVNSLQVDALGAAARCVVERKWGDACGGWRVDMEEALGQEEDIWDFPSAPSLQVAPVMEMYGHLLLMLAPTPEPTPAHTAAPVATSSVPPAATLSPLHPTAEAAAAAQDAAALFQGCLHKLPNRLSCMVGAARAAALSGDGAAAAARYAEVWAQCAPAAAPPDFLFPGLMEAFHHIMPPSVIAADIAASCESTPSLKTPPTTTITTKTTKTTTKTTTTSHMEPLPLGSLPGALSTPTTDKPVTDVPHSMGSSSSSDGSNGSRASRKHPPSQPLTTVVKTSKNTDMDDGGGGGGEAGGEASTTAAVPIPSSHHLHLAHSLRKGYQYGVTFKHTPVDTQFAAGHDLFKVFKSSPAPYTMPLDADPVNRATLTQLPGSCYHYGGQSSAHAYPLRPPVGGYPRGKVVRDRITGLYQYHMPGQPAYLPQGLMYTLLMQQQSQLNQTNEDPEVHEGLDGVEGSGRGDESQGGGDKWWLHLLQRVKFVRRPTEGGAGARNGEELKKRD